MVDDGKVREGWQGNMVVSVIVSTAVLVEFWFDSGNGLTDECEPS